MAVLVLRSIAQSVPTVRGCVCAWLSKAKKQAPVEIYTKEKVPYLHSQKAKYKKWKREIEIQKKSVCCHHTKELPKAFKQKREKRREAPCANLVASPKFATKATVSPCVGVTRALFFVRSILVTFAHFLGHTNPISLVFWCAFPSFWVDHHF